MLERREGVGKGDGGVLRFLVVFFGLLFSFISYFFSYVDFSLTPLSLFLAIFPDIGFFFVWSFSFGLFVWWRKCGGSEGG